jgi:exopolyphosphatase/guanosine-5'-triphosphate,3'-diphosphate pyrophosphatase
MPMSDLRGALDLGTNSIQLLVARRTGDGWDVVREWAATTRLGEGVGSSGLLKPEAMERTLDGVGRFLASAREVYPGLSGVAGGTSALREARNREAFRTACRERFGFLPPVFGGREEAETTFLGVAGGGPAGETVLNLDVGGGSTEVSAGDRERCRFAASLDLGCVRFGERFRLLDRSDTASRQAARGAARELLAPVVAEARELLGTDAIRFMASGGTATTLAATAQSMTAYDRGRVEGWEISRDSLGEWAERLGEMSLAERAALPCVDEGRAQVLPAGLLIIHEALGCLGTERLRVTTRGLRLGMLARLSRGTLAECWHL